MSAVTVAITTASISRSLFLPMPTPQLPFSGITTVPSRSDGRGPTVLFRRTQGRTFPHSLPLVRDPVGHAGYSPLLNAPAGDDFVLSAGRRPKSRSVPPS